jgi:glycosyltransferase involved in cell wall biosynthesis
MKPQAVDSLRVLGAAPPDGIAMFSVIIPTRNRPSLLARAVASVRAQHGTAFEIIVVDDGTDAAFQPELADIERSLSGVGRVVHLIAREKGHGQSYALNFGASLARGDYLCFLDDDDEWTDPGYLARARAIIGAAPHAPELVYFQQLAYRQDGTILPGPIWIEALQPILASSRKHGPAGAYDIDTATLMRSDKFCHVNTTIVRCDFFARVGGLDEAIRYENDRDFYLRCIDRAAHMLYAPFIVSRHNVPDQAMRDNMSTMLTQRERWLSQLNVFNRAALTANSKLIRRFGRRQRGYTKKKMAMSFAREGRHSEALAYALDGLASGFNLKWLAMTMLIAVRAGAVLPERMLRG